MTVAEIKNKEEIKTLLEMQQILMFQQRNNRPTEDETQWYESADRTYLKRMKAIDLAIKSLIQYDNTEGTYINSDELWEMIKE